MKKYVSVLFCLVLVLSLMTGCGRSSNNDVRPDDGNMNRPGVNDSVVEGDNGMVDESGVARPSATDHPVTDEIENGVENAGDAVQRGMDRMGDAVNNATERITGR